MRPGSTLCAPTIDKPHEMARGEGLQVAHSRHIYIVSRSGAWIAFRLFAACPPWDWRNAKPITSDWPQGAADADGVVLGVAKRRLPLND